MAVTADFTNLYIGGAGSAQYNGGSSKGAPKYAPGDCTVAAGTPTVITDNAESNQWAGCAPDDCVCWDPTTAREFRRILSIDGANATVSAACTPGVSKAVNVGGAWNLISHFTSRVNGWVNAAGQPPKGWIKAGTYASETGATGFVDIVTNNGTAALPIGMEGYTTTEGDGTEDCVVIDATGSGLHGVHCTKQFWSCRFMKVVHTTNAKFGWSNSGGTGMILSDVSVDVTGNTTSHGVNTSSSLVALRVHVIRAGGSGIVFSGYGGTVGDCRIHDCGVSGIVRGDARYGDITGCRIYNITGAGISITNAGGVCGIHGNTFYNIGGDAISCVQPGTTPPLAVTDNVFEAITGEAIDLGGDALIACSHNAFYSVGAGGNTYFDANTLGRTNDLTHARNHNVFQTAGTFFVAAAQGDFTPNDIVGQGMLLWNAGGTGKDIGAMQHADPAGGGIDPENIVLAKHILTGYRRWLPDGDLGTLTLTNDQNVLYGTTPFGVEDDLIEGQWHEASAEYYLTGHFFGIDNLVEGEFDAEAWEASRNTGADESEVLKDVEWLCRNVGYKGTFDEAARNTNPGVGNVLSSAGTYYIHGEQFDGTFNEAARNTDPGIAWVVRPQDGGPEYYFICGEQKVGTVEAPTDEAIAQAAWEYWERTLSE